MNTNSYFTSGTMTRGASLRRPCTGSHAFPCPWHEKSASHSQPISSSNRLPIEVISGESPFAENSQWQQLSGGHAGCEGAQWEIRNDMLTLMYAAHHDQLAYRWTEANGLTVWRDDSPEATSFRPDGKGGYYVVEQTTRQLARWDAERKTCCNSCGSIQWQTPQSSLMIVLFIQMAVSGLRTRTYLFRVTARTNSRNSMVSLSFDSIPKTVRFARS